MSLVEECSRHTSLASGATSVPSWCSQVVPPHVKHVVERSAKSSGGVGVVVVVHVICGGGGGGVDGVVVERSVLRRVKPLVRYLRVGSVFPCPMAGGVVVVQVDEIIPHGGGDALLSVRVQDDPTVNDNRNNNSKSLGEALVQCYGHLFRSSLVRDRRMPLLVIAPPALYPTLLLSTMCHQLQLSYCVTSVHHQDYRVGVDVVLVESASEASKSQATQWMRKSNGAVVVLMASSAATLRPEMKQMCNVGIPVILTPPNAQQRAVILKALMASDGDMEEVVDVTGGFSVADLVRLCETAEALGNNLLEARKVVSPALLLLQHDMSVRVDWKDVIGRSDVQSALEQCILWPLRHPERMRALDCKAPAGILLYGPPGCGKTLCINAFASSCQINLLQVRPAQLLSKYTGETESNVRRMFAQARALAPCVLCVDQLDELAPSRSASFSHESGEDTGGAMERVVSTLLNELDGVDTASGTTGVFFVGCSNRPWALDPAVIRPGRIDRLVCVGTPTLEDRRHLLAACGHEELAELTEGLTFAAICTLVKDIQSKADSVESLLQNASLGRVDMKTFSLSF